MAYKHSEDQITAINTFIEFLKDDSQVLIISGSAGTGKTSLIKDYAKASKQNNWNYIPLGVWGRSSSAVTQITGIPAITVAKYIKINKEIMEGSIDDENFNSWYKKQYSKRFLSDLVEKYFAQEISEINGDVIVVDEASCIDNDALIEFSNFCIDNAEGDFKLVFIGDDCQLPPIGQDESNALSQQWIEDNLGLSIFDKVELTVSHRTSEGPLSELWEELRPLAQVNADGEEARKIILNNINNKEIVGYGLKHIMKECVDLFNDKPNEVVLITPRNNEAFDYASDLRKEYFPDLFKSLDIGEKIRSEINGMNEEILTGDEFEVLEIIEDTDKFTIIKAKELSRKQEFTGFTGFIESLKDIFSIFDSKDDRIVDLAIYKPPLSYFQEWVKKGGKGFLRVRMSNDWEDMGWENNEDRVVDDITACKYAYTSTIHSAQGGEWETVVLNLQPDTRNDNARFWYTAATRAKKLLMVLRVE